MCVISVFFFFFYGYVDLRDLHVLTHSFPTRRSSDLSSLLEQQRQSAITRQLAAWAGILAIPTAITGFYGMNFVDMPETLTSWGSFGVLGLMAGICGMLYWRFRRLGWLQSSHGKSRRRPVDGFA